MWSVKAGKRGLSGFSSQASADSQKLRGKLSVCKTRSESRSSEPKKTVRSCAEARSLLLERPDDEDGHQRGDADGEEQQGQFLGLALSLPGARLRFHGFHDDASLPQSAIPDNGPTVDGTGVMYLKFLGGARASRMHRQHLRSKPDSQTGRHTARIA